MMMMMMVPMGDQPREQAGSVAPEPKHEALSRPLVFLILALSLACLA